MSTSRTRGWRATGAAAASISGVRIAVATSWPSTRTTPSPTSNPSALRQRRDRRLVREIDAVVQRLPRDRAVHRAGVDVAVAKPRRDRARDRALAGAGRSVDGDDERPRRASVP